MRSGLSLCFALLILFAASSHLWAQAGSRENGLHELLVLADDLSERSFDHHQALSKYLEALALDPENDEILWRISRCFVDIGEHLPIGTETERNKQLETYEKALEYAERAVKINPWNSMAVTRRAIANGRIALFRGVWESIDLVKQVRVDVEKAIGLDPSNHVAWYILGRTHARVSEKPKILRWPLGLSWASLEEAVRSYERAIVLRPNFIMYRLDCARAYVEFGELDKARSHLAIIEQLPSQDEDDEQFRKEAKELLEEISND